MTDEKRQRRRRAAARRPAPDAIDDGDAIDDRDPRLPARKKRRRELDERRLRLFIATSALGFERHLMFVFHASMARSAQEVRSVLRLRFGEASAATAKISEGFDERDYIAWTVVSTTLRDLLRDVEAHPDGVEANGFDVTHMQTVGIRPLDIQLDDLDVPF